MSCDTPGCTDLNWNDWKVRGQEARESTFLNVSDSSKTLRVVTLDFELDIKVSCLKKIKKLNEKLILHPKCKNILYLCTPAAFAHLILRRGHAMTSQSFIGHSSSHDTNSLVRLNKTWTLEHSKKWNLSPAFACIWMEVWYGRFFTHAKLDRAHYNQWIFTP